MIKRRRSARRGPRKRGIPTPRDNKKLLILRILSNHSRGLTRPKIDRQLPSKQEDTELKLVLEEMIELTWVNSTSVPYTKKSDMTLYKITRPLKNQ